MSEQAVKPVKAWLSSWGGFGPMLLLKEPSKEFAEVAEVVPGVFVPQAVIDHIRGWLREEYALPGAMQWDKGFSKAVIETLKLIEPEGAK